MEGKKVKIFITTSDEPLVVNDFIEEIIKAKSSQTIGVGLIKGKGAIPKVAKEEKNEKKKQSVIINKASNLLSLLLIFGVIESVKNSLKISYFHFSKALNRLIPLYPTKSMKYTARKYGVPIHGFKSVNDQRLIDLLHNVKPDIIINQAPGILKENFLSTASIGVLNRHNALLPENRGRLSPFWALYKQQEFTGVTVHFVIKELDAGEIITQRKFKIDKNETVSSLIKKCYSIAPSVMIEAIEKLEHDNCDLLPNSNEEATYNTNPTFRQVAKFWWCSSKLNWFLSGSGALKHNRKHQFSI